MRRAIEAPEPTRLNGCQCVRENGKAGAEDARNDEVPRNMFMSIGKERVMRLLQTQGR